MPSRSWHSKSRHGCRQCKKRHIKCDLRQTGCENCSKKGLECDFQQQRNVSASRPDSAAWQLSTTHTSSHTGRSLHDLSLPCSGGKLICLVEDNPMAAWDPVLVMHIQKHAFLQHAFRALAILRSNENLLNTGANDYVDAYRLHLAALGDFRCYLANAGKLNWVPTVMFTMAVIIIEIRGLVTQQDRHSLVNMLTTLRSSATLVASVAARFMKQREEGERQRHAAVLQLPLVRLATQQRIAELDHAISALDINNDLDAHYQQSISALKDWLIRTQCRPRTWGHLIQWPASLGDEFIESVHLGQPLALLLYYYWASAIGDGLKSWFFTDWSNSVPVYIKAEVFSS
ncbi:hypothetical protein B0I35DRAFT_63675 [Stachybotrys elegans]|uniref:Zn(2)-C6 fungal-type domain-containing protein n=1 Tax=Stachybotrys elegans TaxID=80388 RepID=A0A8K0SQJ8_9HYPO|nr:hypothetical protein B0I35DRAFT_63675 [Stachybotrys elegans]